MTTPAVRARRAARTGKPARTVLAEAMSEEEFTTLVIQLATVLGWHVCHIRPAMTRNGWRTPYEGHPGLPDLILGRRTRSVFAELKVGTEKPTLDQRAWLAATGGYLWYPRDLDQIKQVLA